jgi:hypothetical protein
MPVSISVLPAPGNVQADREPGGSLPPATYYYTVVAVYQRAAAVVYSNQFSIPSAEVNATTNIDEASVRLQWSQVPGANNYLIYRSTSPGVVDPMEGDNCLGFAGNTNSYTDTGATALIRVVWYPWGLPKVTVTGGTEAAPNTEADIYAAFESSGLSDRLFNRHFDRYGVPDQYYFECYLHIDGALRFQKGTQISLCGCWESTTNAIFLMGYLTWGASYQGAAFRRTGHYYSAMNYGTWKWYGSFIQDYGYMDYTGSVNVRFTQNVAGLCAYHIQDCVTDGIGFDDAGGSGMVRDTYMYKHNAFHAGTVARVGQKISGGRVIYAYYAWPQTNGNPWCRGIKTGGDVSDMFFHLPAVTTKYHAINHQWVQDPPGARSLNNPTYLTVYRCYDGTIRCIDDVGNPVAGVRVVLTDAQGNVVTPEPSDADGYVWLASGTATGGSVTTIVDSSKSFQPNALVDYLAEIVSGTGTGSLQSIKSNTANTITWKGPVPAAPGAGSRYRVKVMLASHAYQGKAAAPYYDTTTFNPWVLEATCPGYEMSTMEITPNAEFNYVVVMHLASGSGGVVR